MAVNLCHPAFGAVVSSSSVSVDGYEVENLLGKKTRWGQPKGFLAEHFIKPPVDITFAFPFNMAIKKIVIDPKVSRQVSSAIDVLSAVVPMPTCLHAGDATSATERRNPGIRSPTDMNAARDSAIFGILSKTFPTEDKISMFCFVNHGYRPLYNPKLLSEPEHQGMSNRGDVVTMPLQYSQPGGLTDASYITVRIKASRGGSIALGNVEIWGQPSRNCAQPVKEWVFQVAARIVNPTKAETKQGSRDAIQSKVAANAKETPGRTTVDCAIPNAPGCPEEFIDPITMEVLVLPVLLPSGHTVDSATLRKHAEVEATWGRHPNDPFTGIPFSATSKPLSNVKLKQRMDSYLLKTSRDSLAPRDVGRARAREGTSSTPIPASLVYSRKSQSVIVGKSLVESKTTSLDLTTNSIIHLHKLPQISVMANKQINSLGSKKRKLNHADDILSKRRDASTRTPRTGFPTFNVPVPCSSVSPSLTNGRSYEDLLSESLDSALERTMSTLPSFSRQTPQPTKKVPDATTSSWSCPACGRLLATKEVYHVSGPLNMYTLPCTHLVCRDCLISAKTTAAQKCSVCNEMYNPADVVKVHV